MSTTSPAALPAPRDAARRPRVARWSAIAAGLVAVAVVGLLLGQGGWTPRSALDPESAAPEGARALARILQDQGVEVVVARDRGTAATALAAAPATLALLDPAGVSDAAVDELVAGAARVVVLEPRARTLDLLLGGSSFGDGFAVAPAAARCAEAALRPSGAVTIGELYTPGPGVTGCFPGEGGYGLLVDGDTAALEARAVLANDVLAEEGNAALALALLGSLPRVVWYVPAAGDGDTAPPTLGELTPPWVTPALVLLLVAAGAAMVWRGRRFGPLVAETLPVTVRGTETTAGRGRLYAQSGDRAHAAAQLRAGTRGRLAALLSLGAGAAASEIADAAAARIGAPPAAVRDLLGERAPRTDHELVEIDRQLRAVEAAVRAARHPERRTP